MENLVDQNNLLSKLNGYLNFYHMAGLTLEGYCAGIAQLYLCTKAISATSVLEGRTDGGTLDNYEWFLRTRKLIVEWQPPEPPIAAALDNLKSIVTGRIAQIREHARVLGLPPRAANLYQELLTQELGKLDPKLALQLRTLLKQNEELDRFIAHVVFLQQPYNYLTLARSQQGLDRNLFEIARLDTAPYDSKLIAQLKDRYRETGTLSAADLRLALRSQKLQEEYLITSAVTKEQLQWCLHLPGLLQEHRLILISTTSGTRRHSTALFRSSDRYYYFDPNSSVGEYEVPLANLAELIFTTNTLNGAQPHIGLSLRIFAFESGPRELYPNKNFLLGTLAKDNGLVNYGLLLATYADDLEGIQFFLTQPGIDVNYRSKELFLNRSALDWASSRGNTEIVRLLTICPDVNVNKGDDAGYTALMAAVLHKNPSIPALRLLLEHPQLDINQVANDGMTALMLAIKARNLEALRLLLASRNLEVNQVAPGGMTALLLAAESGQSEAVRLLLDHPALEVNQATDGGTTALMLAVDKGHTEVVRLLLAQPRLAMNAQDDTGYTAFMSALATDRVEVIRVFLDQPGFEVDKALSGGETALKFAAYEGYFEAVRLLLAQPGIDLNAVASTGETVLGWAILNGRVTVTELLLQHNRLKVTASELERWLLSAQSTLIIEELFSCSNPAVRKILADLAETNQHIKGLRCQVELYEGYRESYLQDYRANPQYFQEHLAHNYQLLNAEYLLERVPDRKIATYLKFICKRNQLLAAVEHYGVVDEAPQPDPLLFLQTYGELGSLLKQLNLGEQGYQELYEHLAPAKLALLLRQVVTKAAKFGGNGVAGFDATVLKALQRSDSEAFVRLLTQAFSARSASIAEARHQAMLVGELLKISEEFEREPCYALELGLLQPMLLGAFQTDNPPGLAGLQRQLKVLIKNFAEDSRLTISLRAALAATAAGDPVVSFEVAIPEILAPTR